MQNATLDVTVSHFVLAKLCCFKDVSTNSTIWLSSIIQFIECVTFFVHFDIEAASTNPSIFIFRQNPSAPPTLPSTLGDAVTIRKLSGNRAC